MVYFSPGLIIAASAFSCQGSEEREILWGNDGFRPVSFLLEAHRAKANDNWQYDTIKGSYPFIRLPGNFSVAK